MRISSDKSDSTLNTNVPGCREVVRQGVNGLLVPVRDSWALSSALLSLIKNTELRSQMGRCSREIVLSNFSSEKVIAQT